MKKIYVITVEIETYMGYQLPKIWAVAEDKETLDLLAKKHKLPPTDYDIEEYDMFTKDDLEEEQSNES